MQRCVAHSVEYGNQVVHFLALNNKSLDYSFY